MEPLVAALFLSVALGSAATIFTWRQRPEPGATPLVALLLGQSWWSVCIIFKLQAADLAGKILWTNVSVLGVVVIPVAWLLFALEYTGRDRYVDARNIALLLVVPVLTVLVVFTYEYHGLYVVRVVEGGPAGVVQLQQGGPWIWVLAGFTYLLGMLGVIPLVGLLASGAVTFRRQGVALLVGIFTPWVTNILFLAGAFPSAVIDPTPIAFSVSGVAYLSALTRHRLLGTSPAPRQRARQHLFDQMQMGAIVVDRNDHVVDMNDTFEAILAGARATVLGTPAAEWLPDYESFPDNGTLDGTLTFGPDQESYDVTVTPVTDARGRQIGRVITFHDVSDLLRQQQRLEVLNRILRHNIRTETNIIHGYAEDLPGEAAEIIQDRAMRIGAFGEKGRTAVGIFDEARGRPTPQALANVVRHATRPVETEYGVSVSSTLPDRDVFVPAVLTPVLVNLLENAVVHHGDGPPRIELAAEEADGEVTITVTDDGPGISDAEVAVLDAGTETSLHHGSGLGLWIVKWGVEIVEGTVRFSRPGDGGTRVTITVPALPRPAPDASDPDDREDPPTTTPRETDHPTDTTTPSRAAEREATGERDETEGSAGPGA